MSFEQVTVLVVDDVPSARKVLKRLLFSLGVTNVLEAPGTVEAYRLATSENIQVIISDLNLNDGTGLELFQKLQSVEKTAAVPFIITTSDTSNSNFGSVAVDNLGGFLLKPFGLEDLRTKLTQALK